MTTVFVTKHALTSGPFMVEAEISHEGRMASWGGSYPQHAHGKDFWLNEEDALKDCERRRFEKIKSLEKQKAKLEKMTFQIK